MYGRTYRIIITTFLNIITYSLSTDTQTYIDVFEFSQNFVVQLLFLCSIHFIITVYNSTFSNRENSNITGSLVEINNNYLITQSTIYIYCKNTFILIVSFFLFSVSVKLVCFKINTYNNKNDQKIGLKTAIEIAVAVAVAVIITITTTTIAIDVDVEVIYTESIYRNTI